MNIGDPVKVCTYAPNGNFSEIFWQLVAGQTFTLLEIDLTNQEVLIDTSEVFSLRKPLWVPFHAIRLLPTFSFFPEQDADRVAEKNLLRKRDEIFRHIFTEPKNTATLKTNSPIEKDEEIEKMLQSWTNSMLGC